LNNNYKAKLPGTHTGNGCRARLPGTTTHCRAQLPGKTAKTTTPPKTPITPRISKSHRGNNQKSMLNNLSARTK
jgi:hypothetical protein